ncbi:secreted RxLR effector protein 161-like [Silene latifolia]|uniref:secreted RxLR effector protein 161-like n=1 Tax=Silene latifolia TaxID=37657 RepID=UPI003D76D05E
MLNAFRKSMMQEFEMTDLGKLQYFLGLEVSQSEEGVSVSQRKYARDLLKKFRMEDCDIAITPMNTNEKLQRNDGTSPTDERLYRSIVGGLNYLTHTRPDIAYSVSVVSRFLHSPTKQHLGAAKRISRYIARTAEKGIWYEASENFKLVVYIDSDWAGSLDDRKSTSGSVFTLGSGAITWSSKKQDIVALSSTEAEYITSGAAGRQAIYVVEKIID